MTSMVILEKGASMTSNGCNRARTGQSSLVFWHAEQDMYMQETSSISPGQKNHRVTQAIILLHPKCLPMGVAWASCQTSRWNGVGMTN